MTKLDQPKLNNVDSLISCGIFKKEIQFLAEKKKWSVNLKFLDSSLHIYFDKLSKSVTGALSRAPDKNKVLVYGHCHPMIDEMAKDGNAIRTPGQNCVELLLGKKRFTRELSKGAFFLFEDWAKRWNKISYKYFGDWEILREVFQDAHNYILCIETPCSEGFKKEAENVSHRTGLPLVWESFELDRLEKIIEHSLSESSKREQNNV